MRVSWIQGGSKDAKTQNLYRHPTLQVSEMVAFGDFKVAGGDLLEGPGIQVPSEKVMCSTLLCRCQEGPGTEPEKVRLDP